VENLGDILRRITEQATLRNTDRLEDTSLGSLETADVCDICQGAGWVSRAVPVGHPDFGQAFPCKCHELDDNSTQVESLRRYSNLGPLNRISFSQTRADGPLPDTISQQRFSKALSASVQYADEPSGWIIFTGPSGSGKTQLAVSIANHCIENGLTTFFIISSELLDHLRSTYAPDNETTYDVLFEQVKNVPLLVLDDLNTQYVSQWAQEKLFQILNHRFNAQLATVITVRGALERLDESLRSRIETAEDFSNVFQLGQYNTRLARRIGDIPSGMLRMNFTNFDHRGGSSSTSNQQASLEHALSSARKFAGRPDGWILLTGPHGSGKTHLAVAMAAESLRSGDTVFFAFVPDLLDHLRTTFSPNSSIGYDELFEQIKTAPLLILDDLGSESSTPWADEKLYQIMVYRHETLLPTIITTSYGLTEFRDEKSRIGSRLMDDLVVEWVPIDAPDYRAHRR